MIVGMNHFTAIGEDRQKTLDFYVGLLGLREGHRPDLGFDGAWLYGSGAQAILHLYFDRKAPASRAGVIDHMAFTASDLKAVKARFDAAAVKYDLRRQKESGIWQLFTYDPTGAKVELDFDPCGEPLTARVGPGRVGFAPRISLDRTQHGTGSLLRAAHLLLPQRSRKRREVVRARRRQGRLRSLQVAHQEGRPRPAPARCASTRRAASIAAPAGRSRWSTPKASGTPTSTAATSTRSSIRTWCAARSSRGCCCRPTSAAERRASSRHDAANGARADRRPGRPDRMRGRPAAGAGTRPGRRLPSASAVRRHARQQGRADDRARVPRARLGQRALQLSRHRRLRRHVGRGPRRGRRRARGAERLARRATSSPASRSCSAASRSAASSPSRRRIACIPT